jgi:tetratricopeptide (TPR) repeat protein
VDGGGEAELGSALADAAAAFNLTLEVTGLRLQAGDRALPERLASLKPAGTRPPLVVVGWDGADWVLLDRMLSAGQLPNLQRLMVAGVHARLFTLKPMISPLIWTSLATGQPPDVHGILDFVRPDDDGEGRVPVTARDRRVPALWNVLSEAGIPVGVVAWWASWPAEAVRGFVVTDRVAYQLGTIGDAPEGELVYPPEAWSWLAPERVSEEEIGADRLARYVNLSAAELERRIAEAEGYEDPVVHLRRILASTETYHRMALAGWRRVQPRALLVYYEGTDTVAHLFAPYTPPRLPHITAEDVARYGDAVVRYHEDMDGLLGELLEAVGPGANVLVCSDHGFAWGEDRPRAAPGVHTATAAWWHRDPGMLVMAGPDVRQVPERRDAHMLDLTPTLLALAGLPPGTGMTGEVLHWALVPSFEAPAAEPVDYVAALAAPAPAGRAGPDPASEELVARLEALGYLDSEGGREPLPTPTPIETPRSLMNLGTVYLEQGRDREALAAYRRAAELDPSLPGAWVKVGIAERRLGHLEEALAAYRRALELGGADVHRESASLGMAVVLQELGKPGEALMLLEAATTFLPESFILWKTYGEGALAQGDQVLARQAYERAAALDDDIEVLNRLAALVLQLDGNAERAAALWRRSLELDPDQAMVRQALAALGAS